MQNTIQIKYIGEGTISGTLWVAFRTKISHLNTYFQWLKALYVSDNLTRKIDKIIMLLGSSCPEIQYIIWPMPRYHVCFHVGCNLRDWSRSGGSYGNNTRVICCPAPGRPESAARGTSPPDNKSRGCCCRNSRPTVINPDYNMTKQRCMKRIYDKIHPKSPPNLATSPTCLHCDVTHLSLTTGVVALHIPSWRIEVREERREARKIVWPVNAGRMICRYQNYLCGIINHHKHIIYCFLDV